MRLNDDLKINAPLYLREELDPLVEEGVDEIYCGFLPQEWQVRFSPAVHINRRHYGPGNIQSFKDLQYIVREAHSQKIPVHLTLNAQVYSQNQLDFLKDYCRKAAEVAGVDGFVVSDPGLIRMIKEWIADISIHVSSLAAIHNSMAVKFFGNLGVERIILPRQVTISEVAAIRRYAPEMEIEVFVLNDGCILEEGLCSTDHRAGAFCMTEWQYQFKAADNRIPLNDKEEEDLRMNQRAYRYWTLCHEACAKIDTPTGYPMGPCGICAIYQLRWAGVSALKVVGRESSMERKIKSVRITRKILGMVINGATEEEVISTSLGLRNTHENCRNGYFCYYPEIIRNRATLNNT